MVLLAADIRRSGQRGKKVRAFLSGAAGALAFAGLFLAQGSSALATESLNYAPVQTEREIQFVTLDLGMKDELAQLATRLGRSPAVDYALVDLDADGDPELFIRIREGETCEAATCTTLVFSKVQNAWMRVMESGTPDISVAKKMTKGYRDLLVGEQPWSWTGRRYMAAR